MGEIKAKMELNPMKATMETRKWRTGRASDARRPTAPTRRFRKYEFRGVTFLVTSGELVQTMRDVRRLYNEITSDFYQLLATRSSDPRHAGTGRMIGHTVPAARENS